MKISKKKIVLAAVAMMIASPVVHAEETQKQETQKKQIAQTTQNVGSAGQGEQDNVYIMDTIVTEATRTAVDNMKYAGSVGVIHEEELKTERNVIEAIMDIPGVDGGNDYGRQNAQRFMIRGFGSSNEDRVIIQQDGVPRSPTLFSGFTSSFRSDTDILKRVEVTKGASSILHGSGAIGGIVSMQTKEARDWLADGEQFGGMVGYGMETNHMHSFRGAVYGDFDNVPINFVAYVKRADHGTTKLADGGPHSDNPDPDAEYVYNDDSIRTAMFKLGSDLGDHKLKLSVFNFDEKLQTLWNPSNQNDPDLNVFGHLRQTDVVFDYNFNPQSPLINFDFKAYSGRGKYDRGYENSEAQGYNQIKNRHYANIDNRWGIKLKNDAIFDTWVLNHNLVAGVDYQNRREKADLFDIRGNGAGVQSDFGNMPNQWHDLGFYVQDIIKFKDLELTLGGRFDRFERELKKEKTDDFSYDFSDQRFSPRIALAYELPFNFTLLAGYAESFRAPNPNEIWQYGALNRMYYYIPNLNLKSETAKEYEVGFSFKQDSLLSDDDALRLKAIYFNGVVDKMIALRARDDLGTPPEDGLLNPSRYGQYQNVDKAKRHGIEVEATYRIGDFRIGGSFETLKVYDAANGEDLNRHASKLMGRIHYSPIENLDFGLKVSYWFDPKSNPSVEVSGATTYYYIAESFTIVDFTGRYTLGKKDWLPFLSGIDISFGVKNIFDKQYMNPGEYSYVNATGYHPPTWVGPGRNWFLNLEVKF